MMMMMMMFLFGGAEGQNWGWKTSSGVGSQNENFCLGGSFNNCYMPAVALRKWPDADPGEQTIASTTIRLQQTDHWRGCRDARVPPSAHQALIADSQ
ncbi:hypothetical protein DTO212C5_6449 [Paecilomyces variotii]|nr:hypothetical protein DTO212C5_6449 [Paecilomyces variotii]